MDNHFQLSTSHSKALNMPEIPLGFSLDKDDGCFTLRHKTAEGVISEIKMPAADLHGLKASIDLWSDRKISEYQVKPGCRMSAPGKAGAIQPVQDPMQA
jgi:hypothetical protein